MKQAVLGATGDVGSLLLKELTDRNIDVKALSRNVPEADKQLAGIEYAAADAENKDSLVAATRGLDVVYATLAVPYGTEPWQRSWPVITRNIIDAARDNQFKLVFLDNVYMYGKADGPMTEDSPVQPTSKKGEVRAEIADMLLDAMAREEINATIGRSADFYGPDSRISSKFFTGSLNEGKAYWMGSPDALRTWSYTPDNARALAILGNDARADQKVWHMPAAGAMKGVGFIALASKVLGRDLETVLVPGNDPEARQAFAASMPEIAEMMYQYDNDYVFDSSRFQETFGMRPTPYEDGFRQVYNTLAERQ
ncbi:MAG TPA: NAD-dependent epimerase/dehydratase family protein [Candidatus Saccharimonadales bacterium]|nr:NAD-dependent epimerase/dehydratase family protein [Candidatus Saccharimonadales bacterium]